MCGARSARFQPALRARAAGEARARPRRRRRAGRRDDLRADAGARARAGRVRTQARRGARAVDRAARPRRTPPTCAGLRRELAPVTSAMIATEPLTADVWAELGWQGCETILDGRNLYTYVQRTADGRIALGGRGDPYVFGSGTAREQPPSASRRRAPARARARSLRRRRGGCRGVARSSRREPHVAAGRRARSGDELRLGRRLRGRRRRRIESRRAHAPRPHPRPRHRAHAPALGRCRSSAQWEPEPFRYAGIHAVHKLLAAADRRELRTGKPSVFARVAGVISGSGH